MKITAKILEKLDQTELGIEELFLLYVLINKEPWLTKYTFRDSSWFKLHRLGLIELDNNHVEPKGYELLSSFNLIEILPSHVKNVDEAFDEWWKNYPSYDDHGQWGRTRRIKTSKVRAKDLYRKLIREGVSANILKDAVSAEVKFRQKNSIKENKMKYMQNPATWLYQREFEAYAEDIETKATDSALYVEYGKKID